MANSNQYKKKPYLQNQQQQCAKLESISYCIPDTMSRCSAGPSWQNQKKCKFARKSTIRNRCMHYIESIDGHCDCAEAQRELTLTLPKRQAEGLEKDIV